jgi:hypothetical protein
MLLDEGVEARVHQLEGVDVEGREEAECEKLHLERDLAELGGEIGWKWA